MMETIAGFPGLFWFCAAKVVSVSTLMGAIYESKRIFFWIFGISAAFCVFVFYLTRMWVCGC